MKKTAVITGAARGIGRFTAKLFHEKGYNVVINCNRSVKEAESLASELGAGAGVFPADVAFPGGADSLIDFAVSRFGKIDVLVNNAGISEQKLFTDITDSEWERMVRTNLSSVFYCCRSAIPFMIKEKGGAIVNVSSIWGIVGASCEVHYSAAKAGVLGLTKALAKELAPSGITVNAIAPGMTDTDMMRGFSKEERQSLKTEIPLGRFASPAEVAEAVLFLAESRYTTGQVLSPNGGFTIY